MKIRVSKHTAFEVEFFAESHIGRGWWSFRMPTIEVAGLTNELGIIFFAFFWSAGVRVSKVEE